jgi:hypothetical protein
VSAEQGRYADEYVQDGPYGFIGSQAGRFAFDLVQTLPTVERPMTFERGELPSWDDDDRRAFDRYGEFETDLALIEPHQTVSADARLKLARNVRRLNAALPFTEGERHWLLTAWSYMTLQGIEVADGIVAARTSVVSAGRRQPLRGDELVRRWAAWRRERDEFKDQRTLSEATFVLRLIGEQLVPQDRWPNGYVGLG